MIKNYLKIALRNLLKNKLFTLINITGLVISMVVALLILNYVSFERSYDTMHSNADRIYRVESRFFEGNNLTDDWGTASFGYASAMKENIPGIENYVRIAINATEQMVRNGETISRENSVVVTEPSFFSLFSFKLVKGDESTALSSPNKVVISQLAAHKFFKNENPIGKILKFATQNNTVECEITGVLEDIPANSHFSYDYFISWSTLPNWIKNFWYLHETYSYVQLQPGVSPESIEEAFPAMSEKYKTSDALKNKTWAVNLVPLKDIHLNPQKQYEREAKGNAKAINALILIAFAILLIAWINYINLTTSRSLERAREVGVRKVSGALKKQLIAQFLTESTIVNLVSLVMAVALFITLIPAFNNFIGKNVGFSLFFMPRFWIIISVFLVSGIVLSGIYPSFVLSKVNPAVILKGKYLNSKRAGMVRKGLVIFQFVASLVLIFGTVIVYAQLKYMQNQPLGVNIDKTLVLEFPAQTENLMEKILSFKQEVKDLPEIKNVAISNAVPGMEIAFFASNRLFEDASGQYRLYEMQTVDYDFIDTYQLKLLEGRGFDKSFTNDVRNLVLNEEAARQLGFANNAEAIGQKVLLEGEQDAHKIIGVIENYHQQSLDKAYTPIMMLMYNSIGWLGPRYLSVKISGENLATASQKINGLWSGFFPQSTFDYFFTDQFYDAQYSLDRKFATIFGLFALLAIFIACLGLWALALFAGLVRRKEMGVRKALGASNSSLLYNLSQEFIYLTLYSAIIGIPLAFFIMKEWISSYAFRTDIKWWFFVIPVLVLVIIATFTISYQTLKTAHSSAVESLKYE
ncbi:ABC transporter permease [Prolixibacteraceae bacterium Z1-6]|uniref:ABC transporter permease n=1 Tax=Draconibacterium aestuarii TaxID=2998507 RepID=A0A9X3F2B7_9BACT|nr:ABC transporter permease [Prolixibacteraceae bacterium Z1-6]